MLKKILPLVLLLVGSSVGVGVGIFLRPETPAKVEQTAASNGGEEGVTKAINHDVQDVKNKNEDTGGGDNEYVPLSNQFVIPIVAGERVVALVVLALSLEVPAGQTDTVLMREPKLRDSFLQILFDHANIGGFDGNFTDSHILARLRSALKEVAQKDLGKDIAKDVLINEIARQDY
ncbi:flagellar basal body-associated FliL family protein [uncultured Sulfitobacter sp.]|uniref:flagellar basal body-associated FliL family protein n=1 Tax=uncultured Sulfitobacter sp. TaxID=191468 RepID=UPI0026116D1A|nr:flagellar basal body-associated FliL family protein [uncultured Sulfitobacter sp.]